MRDYVQAVKACFAGFRGEPLDHHGSFYELTWLNRQWSPGPIEVDDPKVDIAAVNPWMLRMAGEVADGVHVHPIGEPGYLQRHVLPNVARGAGEMGARPQRHQHHRAGEHHRRRHRGRTIAADRELLRGMLSFYGSTPNYAFIWDEAGFEGTTARIRETSEGRRHRRHGRRRSPTTTWPPSAPKPRGTAWPRPWWTSTAVWPRDWSSTTR